MDPRQLEALVDEPSDQQPEPVTQVVVRFAAEVEGLTEELLAAETRALISGGPASTSSRQTYFRFATISLA